MARKKKGSSGKKATASSGKATDFQSAYVRLRTRLDALEVGALRYTLSGDSDDERVKRANKLAEKLAPITKPIRKLLAEEAGTSRALVAASSGVSDPCPDGYYLCNGECIPWPCPPGGGDN